MVKLVSTRTELKLLNKKIDYVYRDLNQAMMVLIIMLVALLIFGMVHIDKINKRLYLHINHSWCSESIRG
jgi:hypothetical protein